MRQDEMSKKYKMCCGPDDAKACIASSPAEAMKKALAWADDSWPESDAVYSAVVWIEDRDGVVVAKEDVTIGPNGVRLS